MNTELETTPEEEEQWLILTQQQAARLEAAKLAVQTLASNK